MGIDIVRIDRIKRASERWGERFLRRIFSEDELNYCHSKINSFESLAARFAAKEAFVKAIGRRIDFKSIKIYNEPSGRPYLIVEDSSLPSNLRFHLSLSHDSEYAIATVIVEELNEGCNC